MKSETYNEIKDTLNSLERVLNGGKANGGGNPYHDELGKFTTGPETAFGKYKYEGPGNGISGTFRSPDELGFADDNVESKDGEERLVVSAYTTPENIAAMIDTSFAMDNVSRAHNYNKEDRDTSPELAARVDLVGRDIASIGRSVRDYAKQVQMVSQWGAVRPETAKQVTEPDKREIEAKIKAIDKQMKGIDGNPQITLATKKELSDMLKAAKAGYNTMKYLEEQIDFGGNRQSLDITDKLSTTSNRERTVKKMFSSVDEHISNALEMLEKKLNGGKGSGNFGHSGRPGKVGGSGKMAGGPASDDARHRAERRWANAGLAHPDLAYLVSAGRKGEHVDLETLLKEKSVQEAMKKLEYDEDTLTQYKGDKKREKLQNELVERLISNDANGSYDKSKPKKERFSGEVENGKEAYIVIGRPAGGKSSVFAEPLSQEHKARIIDSDIVKGWLPEFDGGFGAGRVQEESSMIMERALAKATDKGENVVIPKVGGLNSIEKMAKDLKAKGYKVNLMFNDVSVDSSITRAMSRFAETGRFLSPEYLQSIGDKPNKTFKALANNKDLIDYAEWKSNEVKFGNQPKTVWKTGDNAKKLK